MIHQRQRICDGLSLVSVNTNKFKTAALKLSVALPLTKKGFVLSRLLCGMLGRGTSLYPSLKELNRRLDGLYASSVSVNSTILENLIIFSVSADALDERFVPDGTDVLGGVLEVISQMLFHPLFENGTFPEDKLRHEKQLLKDSFASKINDPRAYAAIRAEEQRRRGDESFPSLEYTMETVSEISSAELTDFYHSLLSYAPWRAIYVGSLSSESIADKLKDVFSGRIGNKEISFSPAPVTSRDFADGTEQMPINQSRLVMVFRPSSEPDGKTLDALTVMNTLFGGTPSSKLFINVRERLGLCYSCGSSFTSATRCVKVSAGISAENKEKTAEEILRQLSFMRDGSFSDAELTAARKSIEFTFDQAYDSPFGIISLYDTREFTDCNGTPEERKTSLLGVSRERIIEAAGLLFEDSRYFLEATLSTNEQEADVNE